MSENGFSLKSEFFYMRHRDEYVQKNIIVFKKKLKKNSNFHCFYPVLNIANFGFRVSNMGDNRAFSITFSTFFDFFDFYSFYSIFKLYNISNKKDKGNDLNILIFRIIMRLCESVEMC